MTDLELTKKCAEAMGYSQVHAIELYGEYFINDGINSKYDPLHSDYQAMALVKRFTLTIDSPDDDGDWGATWYDSEGNNPVCSCRKDLNRAIVECVAAMQVDRTEAAKGKAE